ncbi:MAG: (4Fe-4S)-binding protein [Candidatus Altiarchaeales archaeon ex4484_2]|nr:MAG: (4Fe-4S)-binding protein [Candidatus Altiarchaeales archaeon ex4484_2]
MMEYRINKQKCTGCQACARRCPQAIKVAGDGKAEIISQLKLEQCGGETICPFNAIEGIGAGDTQEGNIDTSRGGGAGRGRGRGLGIGPREGRGRGRGGGGRRR